MIGPSPDEGVSTSHASHRRYLRSPDAWISVVHIRGLMIHRPVLRGCLDAFGSLYILSDFSLFGEID
jgi:hypothetical protein